MFTYSTIILSVIISNLEYCIPDLIIKLTIKISRPKSLNNKLKMGRLIKKIIINIYINTHLHFFNAWFYMYFLSV